ncbi:hypothetical protein FPV67DRAFT_1756151 [Lyophyllum atratum]|nr:hypothetical protein FPV67DRAFT_1756151 [Lyophyllum atratum]
MATLHPRTHTARPYHIHRSNTDLPTPTQSSTRRMPHRSATYHGDKGDTPWQHMAHAYTWVVENEYITLDKRDRKTEQWILEQQMFLAAEGSDRRPARAPGVQQKIWEEMVYSYEIEAERWMRHEAEARRRAAEKERKARMVEEEIRRIETRIRYKREVERRKFAEEKQRMYEQLKEQEMRNRLKADKAALEAWRHYEERWSTLPTSSETLTFASVPWPVVSQPTKAGDIEPAAIMSFLFCPLHSEDQTRKERIRSAQLRWHPDRFQRLLGRVKEEDKSEVEEGVGIVARCLNDMMAQQTAVAVQIRSFR